MKMYSYTSIPVFRTFLSEMIDRAQYTGKDSDGNAIFDRSIKLPILNLRGSIKLHGKNASIVYTKDGQTYFQSRETILNQENNLDGFYSFAKEKESFMVKKLKAMISDFDAIVLYGEWCGPGVQKGSAIASIAKKSFFMFSLVGYKNEDRYWLDNSVLSEFKCDDVYSIYDFGSYNTTLDLSNIEDSVKNMEKLCHEIDIQCPVAKEFGISGKGEGIVFFYDDAHKGPMPVKVKTLKFSTSKNRTKTVIEITPEKQNSISEFVKYAVTENRLSQGLSLLRDGNSQLSKKDVSLFIEWVKKDIEKEEYDVLRDSDLSIKDVLYGIKEACKEYYFKEL